MHLFCPMIPSELLAQPEALTLRSKPVLLEYLAPKTSQFGLKQGCELRTLEAQLTNGTMKPAGGKSTREWRCTPPATATQHLVRAALP